MSLFCFLFIPALFLWRRSWSASSAGSGAPSVVAVLLGSCVALLRAGFGETPAVRGDGASAVFSLADGVLLDGILPLIVHLSLLRAGRKRRAYDQAAAADWMLSWLAPVFALRALYWGTAPDAALLVALPVLFCAFALSWPFWIGRMIDSYGAERAAAAALFALLPFLTLAAEWALFSGRAVAGLPLLLASIASCVPPFLAARRV